MTSIQSAVARDDGRKREGKRYDTHECRELMMLMARTWWLLIFASSCCCSIDSWLYFMLLLSCPGSYAGKMRREEHFWKILNGRDAGNGSDSRPVTRIGTRRTGQSRVSPRCLFFIDLPSDHLNGCRDPKITPLLIGFQGFDDFTDGKKWDEDFCMSYLSWLNIFSTTFLSLWYDCGQKEKDDRILLDGWGKRRGWRGKAWKISRASWLRFVYRQSGVGNKRKTRLFFPPVFVSEKQMMLESGLRFFSLPLSRTRVLDRSVSK